MQDRFPWFRDRPQWAYGRLRGLNGDGFNCGTFNDDTARRIIWPSLIGSCCNPEHDISTRDIRAHTGMKGGKEEERTLARRRGAILCGLISERIDLIRLLLFLGRIIITRGANLLLSALLGF
jgi:hypothetical protein